MVTSEAADSLHMANIHQTGVNALCDKPFEVAQVRMLLMSLLEE
jgi:two-component system chemotaxis response regulator CheY